MKTNNIIMAVIALFVISILSLSVFAYRGNPSEKGPYYNEEVHQQLEAALEAKDYDAWLKIRQDNNLPMRGRIFQVINKENFDKYVELHNAVESGDIETANAIRAELGLGQGQMKRGSNLNGTLNMSNKGRGMQKINGRNIYGNFVDSNGDGVCDNLGLRAGKGKQ